MGTAHTMVAVDDHHSRRLHQSLPTRADQFSQGQQSRARQPADRVFLLLPAVDQFEVPARPQGPGHLADTYLETVAGIP